MSRKKLSPLMEAIALFNSLTDWQQDELTDYIRSTQRRRPKVPKSPSPAPSAGKKSQSMRPSAKASVANAEVETVNVSSASKREKDVDYGGTIDLH